ncbi:hypothetical protein B0J17DRAFT_713284 [Rhizoctonia solani]|nr:hypothetical protein B0J17DRAFT_713284 [Rhizoctonia solani]
MTYTTRAGRTPLDIHIVDHDGLPSGHIGWPRQLEHSDYSSSDGDEGGKEADVTFSDSESPSGMVETNKSGFIGTTSMSIHSIELAAYHRYRPTQRSTLEYYLSKCTPNTLTQLLIRIGHSVDWGQPFQHLNEFAYAEDPLDESLQGTRGRFGSLTTLHLKGIYSCWTSQLYNGLVDLRLEGNAHSIPEDQLVEILRLNLGLQALRVEFHITNGINAVGSEYRNELYADVYLGDLEILEIHELGEAAISTIFESSNWNVTELRVEDWFTDDFA